MDRIDTLDWVCIDSDVYTDAGAPRGSEGIVLEVFHDGALMIEVAVTQTGATHTTVIVQQGEAVKIDKGTLRVITVRPEEDGVTFL